MSSRADVCPNSESRGRWVPPYPTRLSTGSETACIQREGPRERELRENRDQSREQSRLRLGSSKLEKSVIKTENEQVRDMLLPSLRGA